jgi:hypothetical protein
MNTPFVLKVSSVVPRGPGVIGEQPVLRAGNEFEYTSACPLRTPAGKMVSEKALLSDPLSLSGSGAFRQGLCTPRQRSILFRTRGQESGGVLG